MKNIISCQIEGFFSKSQCERIKEIMQGKTFYNFNIQYGGCCGNNTLLVSSEIEGHTAEELKEMFIYSCLTELARVNN